MNVDTLFLGDRCRYLGKGLYMSLMSAGAAALVVQRSGSSTADQHSSGPGAKICYPVPRIICRKREQYGRKANDHNKDIGYGLALAIMLFPAPGFVVLFMANERETLGQRAAIILCVDDEPNLLVIRQLVLSAAGYKTLAATNGKRALEIFKNNPIDLVITDHLLPDVSGAQVAIEMKKLKPEVPIILLSGLPDEPEGAEHADMFLTKGMPVPELLASVAEVLSRKRSQQPKEKAG